MISKLGQITIGFTCTFIFLVCLGALEYWSQGETSLWIALVVGYQVFLTWDIFRDLKSRCLPVIIKNHRYAGRAKFKNIPFTAYTLWFNLLRDLFGYKFYRFKDKSTNAGIIVIGKDDPWLNPEVNVVLLADGFYLLK